MAFLIAESNCDGFFPLGTTEGARLYSCSRNMEDLVVRLQAAVTIDANMLRRVGENFVRRAAVCLEIDGGRFELRDAIGLMF
jgi:hypothetical protein